MIIEIWSLHLLNGSICFPPGDDKRSRGCSDDPRRGLRLHGGLRVRLPVHHQEDPQPHPGDAQAPAHAAAGGDVLAAPEDGRLLPHLLPAKRQAVLQGHVPGRLPEVLGRPHAPSLSLNPPCRLMTDPDASCTKCKSAARLALWRQSCGPGWAVSSRSCLINDYSHCLMDDRKISSTLKPFMARESATWRMLRDSLMCFYTEMVEF